MGISVSAGGGHGAEIVENLYNPRKILVVLSRREAAIGWKSLKTFIILAKYWYFCHPGRRASVGNR